MIKFENRLKKRKQFNYLHKCGLRVSNLYLSVIYLPVKTKNFKVGYSVSKKVGKAVTRNKIKRRLKECVLKLSNNIKNEFYIIISPKIEVTSLSFNELFVSLKSLFIKAELLYDNC